MIVIGKYLRKITLTQHVKQIDISMISILPQIQYLSTGSRAKSKEPVQKYPAQKITLYKSNAEEKRVHSLNLARV